MSWNNCVRHSDRTGWYTPIASTKISASTMITNNLDPSPLPLLDRTLRGTETQYAHLSIFSDTHLRKPDPKV